MLITILAWLTCLYLYNLIITDDHWKEPGLCLSHWHQLWTYAGIFRSEPVAWLSKWHLICQPKSGLPFGAIGKDLFNFHEWNFDFIFIRINNFSNIPFGWIDGRNECTNIACNMCFVVWWDANGFTRCGFGRTMCCLLHCWFNWINDPGCDLTPITVTHFAGQTRITIATNSFNGNARQTLSYSTNHTVRRLSQPEPPISGS